MCIGKPIVSAELDADDLGYPSNLSLFNALLEWIEIRRWCLLTLSCALVQLGGGVDAVLGTRKVLLLDVVPVHHSEHDGSPAMAFQLGQAALVDRDRDDFLRANWACIQDNIGLCGLSTTLALLGLLALLPAEPRGALATLLGSVPDVFVVHGTNMVSSQVFTLFRLPLRHVASEDPTANAHTRAALEDLVKIMQGVLCTRMVFRRPEDPNQLQPDWGIFERTGRRGKMWKWKHIPADEETWRGRAKALEELRPGSTSGLTTLQVLTLFDYRRLGTNWWYVFSSLLLCELGLMLTARLSEHFQLNERMNGSTICTFEDSGRWSWLMSDALGLRIDMGSTSTVCMNA